MSEQLQIPVELPVESVKAYVQGEQITPYNFDLLQNYFEGRIIKLLEEMPMMIYYAVANNGRILDKPCSPVVIEREAAIALIKGEK